VIKPYKENCEKYVAVTVCDAVQTSELKVETACSSEMLESTYESVRCHRPEKVTLNAVITSNLTKLGRLIIRQQYMMHIGAR
jgi:hypothetical protein